MIYPILRCFSHTQVSIFAAQTTAKISLKSIKWALLFMRFANIFFGNTNTSLGIFFDWIHKPTYRRAKNRSIIWQYKRIKTIFNITATIYQTTYTYCKIIYTKVERPFSIFSTYRQRIEINMTEQQKIHFPRLSQIVAGNILAIHIPSLSQFKICSVPKN